MAITIEKQKELSGRKVVAGQRMYMTADKTRVVPADSPEAAYLHSAEGSEIPVEDVDKFGLRKQGEAYFLPDAEEAAADAQNGTEDPDALVPVEQFDAVTKRLAATQIQLDGVKAQNAINADKLTEATTTIGQKDAEIAGLKADGEAASQELAQRDADITKLSEENKTLKEQNATLAAQLEKAKSDLADAQTVKPEAAKAKTAPDENKAVKSAPENKAMTSAPEIK